MTTIDGIMTATVEMMTAIVAMMIAVADPTTVQKALNVVACAKSNLHLNQMGATLAIVAVQQQWAAVSVIVETKIRSDIEVHDENFPTQPATQGRPLDYQDSVTQYLGHSNSFVAC